MLLDAPAVRQRAPSEATDDDLAQAAHEAILEAISKQPTPLDRAIGEAVMAALPDYEGQTVDVRKRELEKKHGYGPDTYKRRRPIVLQSIAEHLQHGPPEGSSPASPQYFLRRLVPPEHADAISHLEAFYRDVYGVRCAIAAHRCAKLFEESWGRRDNEVDGKKFWRMVLMYEFRKNVAVIISGQYLFGQSQYSNPKLLSSYVPGALLKESASHLDKLYGTLPMTPQTQAMLVAYHFGPAPAPRLWQDFLRAAELERWRQPGPDGIDIEGPRDEWQTPADSACQSIEYCLRNYVPDGYYQPGLREAASVVADYHGVVPRHDRERARSIGDALLLHAAPLGMDHY